MNKYYTKTWLKQSKRFFYKEFKTLNEAQIHQQTQHNRNRTSTIKKIKKVLNGNKKRSV